MANVTKRIWQPIVNCGYSAGEIPMCFESSFFGFETELECLNWIEKNRPFFNEQEIAGGVCAMPFDVENPTIIDSDDNIIKIYAEDGYNTTEDEKTEKGKVYVVESKINLSCEDTETIFDVVGVADNKDRAKEILKQEVEYFFGEFNERFVSNDPDDDWGAERELSVDNKEDFPNDEYYRMVDTDLSVFCEINIVEKTINA